MKSIIKAISSSIVAILSKIAKFFLSIPSTLFSIFLKIKLMLGKCLMWIKRLISSVWSISKSTFAKIRRIKKPLWFQWSLFPNDKVPPTQSIYEMIIYISILSIFIYIFLRINTIPNNIITIEADKLNYFNELSKANDSTYYLHYQVADINLVIPMKYDATANNSDIVLSNGPYLRKKDDKEKNYTLEPGVVLSVYEDSMMVNCSIIDKNRIKIKTNLNPFWDYLFFNARHIGILLNNNHKDSKFHNEFKKIYKTHNNHYVSYFHYYDLRHLCDDTLSRKMVNYYRLKLSSNFIDYYPFYNKIDTIWQKKTSKDPLSFNNVHIGDNKQEGFIKRTNNYYRLQKEKINKIDYISGEAFQCNNVNKDVIAINHLIYTPITPDSLYDIYNDNTPDETPNEGANIYLCFNSKLSTLSIDSPSWFSQHDISQGWYQINLHSPTIDSIGLTINFVGATEFYPINLSPDEIGSNYIKIKDSNKILQIKDHGLTFYARFPELENRQTIRVFFITAIMSGLIILILSFIIIGIYRSIKILKSMKKNKRIVDIKKTYQNLLE